MIYNNKEVNDILRRYSCTRKGVVKSTKAMGVGCRSQLVEVIMESNWHGRPPTLKVICIKSFSY